MPEIPGAGMPLGAGGALVIGSQHPLDLIRGCSVVADKQDTRSSSF